jgi:hypothetical protein
VLPDGKPHRADILGPSGTWQVKKAAEGAVISKTNGKVPDSVTITLPQANGKAAQIGIDLVHRSGKKVTPFGISRFVAPIAGTSRSTAGTKTRAIHGLMRRHLLQRRQRPRLPR